MGLRAYIIKRIAYSILLVFFVISLNFFLFMVMPGDPTELFIPRGLTPDQRLALEQKLRNLWGIGDPIHIRYPKYVVSMFSWQFGDTISLRRGTPVSDLIQQRLPNTLLLMGGSTVLAILIGVIQGVWAAHKRGKVFDTMSTTTSIIFQSLPVFWMGMIFILIFFTALGWLPNAHIVPEDWALNPPKPLAISGSFPNIIFSIDPGETIRFLTGRIKHLILPLATLTLFQYGGFLLLTRATMLEALTEDYIVTARAKGVPERKVLYKHALKNASLPLITATAISLGFMLSGAMITETVYTWMGIGTLIKDAIGLYDYNVLQAIFYVVALCVIIANFVADILYGVIDPRIKYG